MTNIPLIAIMMLTMMMGGISNINAITHNTTITNEDDGSIDKSKFDWGPVNGPEPGTVPSAEGTINDNVQPYIASPFSEEKVIEEDKKRISKRDLRGPEWQIDKRKQMQVQE